MLVAMELLLMMVLTSLATRLADGTKAGFAVGRWEWGLAMDKLKYCDEHSCIKAEINNLKEDNREMKQQLNKITDEIRNLSTHEKVFVAFVGFMGIALSAGGSVLGVLIANVWK